MERRGFALVVFTFDDENEARERAGRAAESWRKPVA